MTAALPLDAFNLWVGAAIDTGTTWVVTEVTRYPNTERVTVEARHLTDEGRRITFDFDYCEPIAVVGNVVNADDPADDNIGARR